MDSVWTNTIERPKFDSLKNDIKTDVLIIGGGLTGILCAYELKKAGVDCVLVEADKICGGITKNTTAKITLQQGIIYSKILSKYGCDTAKLYFESQKNALNKMSELCKTIDCDYEEQAAYVYSLSNSSKIEKEAEVLNRLGCYAQFTTKLPLPFTVVGAVGIKNQAQFHPLKFAIAIAQNIPVYEKTKVIELGKNKAVTNRGNIAYKKVIIATHFPFINKHGGYFLKLYQHRSYVIALENAENVNGMYVDENLNGLSFRNYKDLLLLGGGSHRTGKNGGGWLELEQFAREHYTKAKVVKRWATQDCMSLDGMAYIGQYSPKTPNMYVATGYNKWGMTTAMTAATLLTDLITGKDNDYADVFSPNRNIIHPQLAINIGESLVGLLKPTAPRCPHMGCALKYNKQEHSWDCSCHGSRFDEKGQLIDNPATDDKQI